MCYVSMYRNLKSYINDALFHEAFEIPAHQDFIQYKGVVERWWCIMGLEDNWNALWESPLYTVLWFG